jgi:hypothetical protein
VLVPGEPPDAILGRGTMCLIYLHVDPETSGEKGEVSLRRDECGASCDATAQAEEEGQQDGLDDNGLHTLSTLHCTQFSITWLFPRLLIISPSCFPSYLSLHHWFFCLI